MLLQLFLALALSAFTGNCATDPSSVFETLSVKDIEMWHSINRDGESAKIPLAQDFRLKSSQIANAHEVLRKELQLFLDFKDAPLSLYLNHIIQHRSQPFSDEYGQEIRSYKKVFRFIWEQYNETVVNNYAVGQFDKDKLDLCSVARFFSHRVEVRNRQTIMKRMNDALGYKCHPCSPYKRREHDTTIVADYYSLSSDLKEVSPEESLILCNKTNPELQVYSQKVAGLIWQESSGGLKWAHSCDYHGSDIDTTQSSTPEQCGQNCVNNDGCTHFTWNSGTCFLKHFKSTVDPGDSTSCVSGWIKRNDGAQPQVSPSSTCFYYVENRPELMASSGSETSEECRDGCVSKEQCAHFAWITGWCYHLLSSDSTGAVDLKKTACGWISDRVLQKA